MARNPECKCLCHGDQYGDGHADVNFSCGMCYSGMHMESLNRRPKHPKTARPKQSKPAAERAKA